jgi:hypothetical protein
MTTQLEGCTVAVVVQMGGLVGYTLEQAVAVQFVSFGVLAGHFHQPIQVIYK